MKTPPKEHRLLDEVITKNKLRNDAHLAEKTGFARATISRFRNGTDVSASFKVALAETFHMSIKRINELDPSTTKENA